MPIVAPTRDVGHSREVAERLTMRPMTANTRVLRRSRVELSCMYCGHAVGDVFVSAGRRLTLAALRAAYAGSRDVAGPAWNAHGEPRCPRCAAKLFVEVVGAARIYPDEGVGRRPREIEETEDAYAREDVYVPAGELPD